MQIPGRKRPPTTSGMPDLPMQTLSKEHSASRSSDGDYGMASCHETVTLREMYASFPYGEYGKLSKTNRSNPAAPSEILRMTESTDLTSLKAASLLLPYSGRTQDALLQVVCWTDHGERF